MTETTSSGPGALAQVIATRGGQASPEGPFVIEHREALIYMLCEAAELEHAIMCQYLYAAFSLKQSTEEGLTAAEFDAVDRWRKTVSHIATQEMLHLALVQNLLSAVGASPHLSRPNLPQPAGHYPPGVILTLLPFGEPALRHFMFLERPEGMDLADAPGLAAVERAAPAMQEGEIVPQLQDFATVGHLYRSIEEGIKHLCSKYGQAWLFVGPPAAQASEKHFGWSQLVNVTDAESAQRAIDTILEQGEGPRGHWRNAHFGTFVAILDEYQQLKGANPGFEPARPVLPATVRPAERDSATPLISNRFTARCTDLFNVSYEVLLQTLARYFAHTEETEGQLATLAQVTLDLMFNVIKPLGQFITSLPVGDDAPGRTAGPSFELFYESDYLLPHRDAAWALLEERLREAAAFADRLKNEGAPEVAARLQPIGSDLLGLGHTLATCRADWGGRSFAGEVTVAHRRRDAQQARTNPEVSARVAQLVSALQGALGMELSYAMRLLLAATSGAADPDNQVQRVWRRGVLADSDRRFNRVVDLADLLVGVIGDSVIQVPDFSEDHPVELDAAYAEITRCLRAVPSEALLVDPHPSPTFAPEEQRQHLPGVVDQASALALIDELTRSRTSNPLETSSVPAAAPPSNGHVETSSSIANLLTQTYEALLAVLGRGVSAEADLVAARHRLRDISTRLRARVLRPLAEALCRLTDDPAGALQAAKQAGPGGQWSTVEDRLRALALAATRTRVGLQRVPPELLEATAGLQEIALSCGTANDAEQTAFLDQLRTLESSLPGSIQLERNGPYLLTHVDMLVNGLGDPIATYPQMALCRCGQSASKPWCDGSHALADFSDAKDPNRVADRRDTYVGLSVTVFDNRGICQHSGYCTDRIPLAFRTDKDPFVAPSGARMDEIIRAVRNCPSGALSFAVDAIEGRDEVDWHNQRAAAVTVTSDGPYRVTGTIPLLDATGAEVGRAQGASLEHYALCRCGHSQNKPFCSGMHWYIQFRDPIPDPSHPPTLYEWCGGMPALTRMSRLFFERYVPDDPLLAPLFAEAPADHPEKVASWLGEVLGGPRRDRDQGGGYSQLLATHGSRSFSEEQRARWVSLLCRSADEAGLPADPEFRSAFNSYIEWQSRQVLQYSQPDAAPPADVPTPIWNWSPAGAPPPPTQTPAEESAATLAMPNADESVSFAAHIKPLFRERDRQSMAFAFDLWSYDAVKTHARAIVGRLREGTMPCDGPWPEEKTVLFQRWIDTGALP